MHVAWLTHGQEVFDRIIAERPEVFFLAMVKLAQVYRVEIGQRGTFVTGGAAARSWCGSWRGALGQWDGRCSRISCRVYGGHRDTRCSRAARRFLRWIGSKSSLSMWQGATLRISALRDFGRLFAEAPSKMVAQTDDPVSKRLGGVGQS